MQKLRRLSLPTMVARFENSTEGSIAVVVALVLSLLVGLTGGAVDYGRVLTARGELQSALDAAILVAGRKLQVREATPADAIAAAKAFFETNKSELTSEVALDIRVENGTRVRGRLEAKVPATFVAVPVSPSSIWRFVPASNFRRAAGLVAT